MGHSAGGYATVRALAAHPDFFHVGVSSAGNHDQRGYRLRLDGEAPGAGRARAITMPPPTRTSSRAITGKLLLAIGEMDDNVHPALSYQLIDALIKADKDFELIVLPNENHGTMTSHPYFLRRAMGFLHEHLPRSGMREPIGGAQQVEQIESAARHTGRAA